MAQNLLFLTCETVKTGENEKKVKKSEKRC